jgi:hypothetical protein
MQYNPFIHLSPVLAVTTDAVVRGVRKIVCRATRLESTGLVVSYGGTDLHFAHSQSSGGFDLLASDFKYSLLLTIMIALAVTIMGLRIAYKRKIISSAWQ